MPLVFALLLSELKLLILDYLKEHFQVLNIINVILQIVFQIVDIRVYRIEVNAIRYAFPLCRFPVIIVVLIRRCLRLHLALVLILRAALLSGRLLVVIWPRQEKLLVNLHLIVDVVQIALSPELLLFLAFLKPSPDQYDPQDLIFELSKILREPYRRRFGLLILLLQKRPRFAIQIPRYVRVRRNMPTHF